MGCSRGLRYSGGSNVKRCTVAHTSRDSPSVTALPPDEGVDLADVDSAQDEQSMS